MKENILEVETLSRDFGGLHAVDNVSLKIKRKMICGLIGPNGSGKTTLFNLISGVLKVSAGRIYFNNERIENLPPYKINRKGMGRTFQLVRLFPTMTVMENLIAVQSGLNFKNSLERALYVLDYIGMAKCKTEYVKDLSLGEQKMLEFARNLMFNSELILLDEPSSGLDHASMEKIKETVLELRQEGKTFFIVEHNMKLAMDLCERIFVLDHGSLICEGTPERVRNDEKVMECYLGKKREYHVA